MADEQQNAGIFETLRGMFFGAAEPSTNVSETAPVDADIQLRTAMEFYYDDPNAAIEALRQGADPNNGITAENYYPIIYEPELLQALIAQGLDLEKLSESIRQFNEASGSPYQNILHEMSVSASYFAFTRAGLTVTDLREQKAVHSSIGIATEAAPGLSVDVGQMLDEMQRDFDLQIGAMNFTQYSLLRQTLGTLQREGLITDTAAQSELSPNAFSELPSSRFAIANVLSERGQAYEHLKPDGRFTYTVQPNDTAWGIARRFHSVIGGENFQDSLTKIIEDNALAGGAERINLRVGQILNVPVKDGFEVIQHEIQPGDTLWSLTQTFNSRNILDQSLGAKMNMSTVENLAAFNNVAVNGTLTPGNMLYVPIHDDFAGISPITPTANATRQNTLLVTAEPNSPHHRSVFEIAAGAARAIDPADDLQNVYSYITTSFGEYSPELRNMIAGAVGNGEDVVINLSIQNAESGMYANDLLLAESIQNMAGSGEVSFFVAAGNAYGERGPYTVAAGYGNVDNSVLVGAAREMAGSTYLEFYSSSSADIVAPPLPLINGEPEAGTSFASPYMAALFRKMNERYGETLSHTEIMDAAYLSTDINLLDTDNSRLSFQTNGAGKPHHERAGAGMIDPDRWAENLDKMVTLKRTLQHDAQLIEQNVNIGETAPTVGTYHQQGLNQPVTLYAYKVPIPADMTLDRLTLHAPFAPDQSTESLSEEEALTQRWIQLDSPSGFQTMLPPSLNDLHPTTALALEDVRQGDYLTILTRQPLDESAYIRIRGYEDGNAVQLLRDNTERLEPHATYAGGIKVAPDQLPPASPETTPQSETLRQMLPDIKF